MIGRRAFFGVLGGALGAAKATAASTETLTVPTAPPSPSMLASSSDMMRDEEMSNLVGAHIRGNVPEPPLRFDLKYSRYAGMKSWSEAFKMSCIRADQRAAEEYGRPLWDIVRSTKMTQAEKIIALAARGVDMSKLME